MHLSWLVYSAVEAHRKVAEPTKGVAWYGRPPASRSLLCRAHSHDPASLRCRRRCRRRRCCACRCDVTAQVRAESRLGGCEGVGAGSQHRSTARQRCRSACERQSGRICAGRRGESAHTHARTQRAPHGGNAGRMASYRSFRLHLPRAAACVRAASNSLGLGSTAKGVRGCVAADSRVGGLIGLVRGRHDRSGAHPLAGLVPGVVQPAQPTRDVCRAARKNARPRLAPFASAARACPPGSPTQSAMHRACAAQGGRRLAQERRAAGVHGRGGRAVQVLLPDLHALLHVDLQDKVLRAGAHCRYPCQQGPLSMGFGPRR